MISRLFLAFNALAIGLIGILYLYDPNLLLARYDLATGSAGMDNMLRSTYGGLFLASASVFLLGVFSPIRRRDALAFVAIFMAGAALGRIVSILAVGSPPATIMPLLYFEIVMTGLAVTLYIRTPRAQS
ncbi:MAG: DUF4345 domain-containing protein [Henriciella sp.]|nr:DUF4345 domain-containing protein [Henriciella sp.]